MILDSPGQALAAHDVVGDPFHLMSSSNDCISGVLRRHSRRASEILLADVLLDLYADFPTFDKHTF